jgi:hypothetical protein
MPLTYLEAVRTLHARACARSRFLPVDADLDLEAGMDGNYGRMLQIARDLDAATATPPAHWVYEAGEAPDLREPRK